MRRTSVLKVSGLFLLSLLAIAGAAILWRWSLEHRRWRHLESRVAELRAIADTRLRPRPVLRGTPVPGNAWDDYLPALALVATSGDEEFETAEQKRLWLNRYVPAVEAMQRGTHRAEVGWVSIRARQGEDDREVGFLGQVLAVGRIAVDRANMLFEEGKTGPGTELTLDLLKFAEDVAGDGDERAQYTTWHLQETAMIVLEHALQGDRLTAENCRQINRELSNLDTTFPRLAPVLLGRLEQYGTWILKQAPLADLVGCRATGAPIPTGWRELYSERLMKIAAFDAADVLISRLLRSDQGRESEEMAQRDALYTGLEPTNTYTRVFTNASYIPKSGRSRSLRSWMRTIRIAAHFGATGEALDLIDAEGDKIAHGMEGGKLVLWYGNSRRDIPRRHD
jgi:hypothetical protein